MDNMKKRISILLAIVIVITSLIIPVTANGTDGSSDGAYISTGDKQYPVTMGDTYTYEYRLNLGKKLTAIDASVSYDTDGLELVNYTFPILGDSANAGTYGGKLYFNYSSAAGISFSSDSSVLIRATFKVKSVSGTFDVHTDITDMARYQEVKLVENGIVLNSFTHKELITDDDSKTSIYIETGNKYYKVKRGKTYNYICYLKTDERVGNLVANTNYDSYGLSTSSSTRTTYQSYSGKSFAEENTVLVSIPFTVSNYANDNNNYYIYTNISKLQDINEDTISRYTITEVIEGLSYVTRDPNEPPTEPVPTEAPPEPTECGHWRSYTREENLQYFTDGYNICGYSYELVTYCSDCNKELDRTENWKYYPTEPLIEPTEPVPEPTEAPWYPTEPVIEPTVPPYPDDPSGNIYINADGNIYQVDAGSDHIYSYLLNIDGTVCGVDAVTSWDAPELSMVGDPSFPMLGASLDYSDPYYDGNVIYNVYDVMDWHGYPTEQQIRFNYTNPEGVEFDTYNSILISFVIHVSEDAPAGMYYITTNIKTLEGQDEERLVFEGTDVAPDRLWYRDGALDGEPGEKEITHYTVDEQTYMTYSFEDKTFTVNADHNDDRTYGKFRALYLDDMLVDYNNYTKESGSLKLTLKFEYMETLVHGDHVLRFVFADGEAYSVLHVLDGAQYATEHTSPTTSSDNPNYPYYNDGLIRFDAASAGWRSSNSILFYIYDLEANCELAPWGSKKKLGGTKGANNIWSFDAAALGVVSGRQYMIIFNNSDTGAQTYDLLLDTSCFGDVAYVNPYKMIENPYDSNKSCMEARWGRSGLGPRLQVTSIGNVVGETCPNNTTPYAMMVDFLKNTLSNARLYTGKSDQQIVDDTADALGLSSEDVSRAISESGVSVNWEPPYVAPTEPSSDSFGYIVGAYYLTGSINGDNSGTSNVHKGLRFKDNTSDSMLLDNVRLTKGDVVRVARYNGGNTFTVYPDGVGRDITIDTSGRYDFYFKPYELGNANYWYVTPSYLGEVTPFILGDTDANGSIEVTDATFIQRWLAKIDTPYSKAELMRGDVDESGDLELTDVTWLQYYLANMRTPYQIGKQI